MSLETLWLDSLNDPTVTSTVSLELGRSYVLQIEGNLTYHDEPADLGDPDEFMYPSPGAVATHTFAESDYETVYAWPSTHSNPPPALPSHHERFELDLGSGWAHLAPTSGHVSAPDAHHRYRIEVVGEGSTLGFRLVDSPYTDNGGRLRLDIIDASALRRPSLGRIGFG